MTGNWRFCTSPVENQHGGVPSEWTKLFMRTHANVNGIISDLLSEVDADLVSRLRCSTREIFAAIRQDHGSDPELVLASPPLKEWQWVLADRGIEHRGLCHWQRQSVPARMFYACYSV
jgi:hypothetical protein